jgi:hypothetical protein
MGKNRSGPSDLTFTFGLTSYRLGTDADGDAITAPVVEPAVRDAKATQAAAKEGRLKDRPAVMLRELRGLLERDAETVCPGPDFPSVSGIARGMLRKRLIDRGWFSEDMLRIASDGAVSLERKAYAVEANALNTLKRNGFACCTQDWVWLT